MLIPGRKEEWRGLLIYFTALNLHISPSLSTPRLIAIVNGAVTPIIIRLSESKLMEWGNRNKRLYILIILSMGEFLQYFKVLLLTPVCHHIRNVSMPITYAVLWTTASASGCISTSMWIFIRWTFTNVPDSNNNSRGPFFSHGKGYNA